MSKVALVGCGAVRFIYNWVSIEFAKYLHLCTSSILMIKAGIIANICSMWV